MAKLPAPITADERQEWIIRQNALREALTALDTPTHRKQQERAVVEKWYAAMPETLMDWYIARSKESPEEPT
jgi:hypothetical protein